MMPIHRTSLLQYHPCRKTGETLPWNVLTQFMPLKMTDQQGDRFDGAIKRTVQFFIAGFQYPLVVSAVVNFSILILGGLNIHKCPVNNYIPIFMIVIGAVGLFSKFLSFLRSRIEHVGVLYCETALYSVEVVFFLLGTFWVYSEFKPSFDPVDKEKYCNKTAYLFAFIYLTLHYTIILGILLAVCCFMGWALLSVTANRRKSCDMEAQPANV